jgi:hypothetical protein
MGQINVTLPADVHRALRVHGLSTGQTLTQVLVGAAHAFLPELSETAPEPRGRRTSKLRTARVLGEDAR